MPVFVADKWKGAAEQKSDASGKAGDGMEAATGSQGGGERGGVIGRMRMVYDPRSQAAADKGQSAEQVSCCSPHEINIACYAWRLLAPSLLHCEGLLNTTPVSPFSP